MCIRDRLLTTEDYINVGRLRTQGYIKAIQDNGLSLENHLIIKVEDTQVSDDVLPELESSIADAFKKNNKIDGIFAVNEIYAGAALRVLRKLGKAIPQDVALICFTDGLISRYSYPSLTTVKQHAEEIGKAAAGKLIERLENEDDNLKYEQKVIKSVIIEREST